MVQEFMQRGLADDYCMMVWPVILGRGKHYWGLNVETTDPEAIVHQESQTW
jgi:dihydrofolate reductase